MDHNDTRPSVAQFFAGRSVLITGATGFVGKALVEKLLRACPDVHRAFLIVRPKKGVPPSERVKEIVGCDLFEPLIKQKPSILEKLVIVPGDLILPGLGLAPGDMEIIRREVSVVMHCAATVNFNEKLKLALQLNVLSVQQLLAFTRTFSSLAAFVHVSTAFSNCDKLCIREKIYPTAVDPKALMSAVFSMDDDIAVAITPKLIGKRPNTYTFTKSLAEEIVRQDGQGLPVAIMRPSIIGAMYKGTIPGWQDNLNGPGGMYISAAHGLLRVMKGDTYAISDIVPVDYCANMILAIAWSLGTSPAPAIGVPPPVYHCTSGAANTLTWGRQFEMCFKVLDKVPVPHEERTPIIRASFNFVMNPHWLAFWDFVWHRMPASFVDALLVLVGQKPIMQKLNKRLGASIIAYEFFTSHSWWWEFNNGPALADEMSPEDAKEFTFDMAAINWSEYLENYWRGTWKFLKRDPPEKIAKQKKFTALIKAVLLVITVLLFSLLAAFLYFLFLSPSSPLFGESSSSSSSSSFSFFGLSAPSSTHMITAGCPSSS